MFEAPSKKEIGWWEPMGRMSTGERGSVKSNMYPLTRGGSCGKTISSM
jgi:hypothetical protein